MRSVTVHSLMRVANRLQGLAQSEIRRMTRECERVGGINLGQGICDLPTPPLLREDALEAAITSRTRAVVVCTPSNPSGKMFRSDELEALARVARRHDLLVITDEIYEYIRYDGRPHLSPAAVAGMRERTLTIMGLSKTFSITGWP